MTFNSLHFIFVFLPFAWFGFLLAHRAFGWAGVYPYLFIASLIFCAQFSLDLVFVLTASILANFLLGRAILSLGGRRGRLLAWAGVTANLAALGWFKYVNFFIEVANGAGAGLSAIDVIAPIGVSFFTFTQIGWLIEAASGQARPVGFARYAVFAGFFPCVTAGPLLLQREMFDQMENRTDPAYSSRRVAVALTLFGIGLFKKVVLADSFAPKADIVFDAAANGVALGMGDSWIGALSYTLQLYFDFSGYSDMAIGVAFLFGFRLPLNFNSPLKAVSISDFWNRWHMTMTRFFTTFLFTPLAMRNMRASLKAGRGRFGKWVAASAIPVFYTFLLAGIWHGAGWTFVVFGLIHGAALVVNHGWREARLPAPPRALGWALTMGVVVAGLVMFRAPDVGSALAVYRGMLGLELLAGAETAPLGFNLPWALTLLAVGGLIVTTQPNSQEILRSHWTSSDRMPDHLASARIWLRWSPSAGWAAAVGLLIVVAVGSIGDATGFLYYRF